MTKVPLAPGRRRPHLLVWLGLALALAFGYAAPARAQSAEELSEARAAFQRGIELEQAKNWTGALKAFRQVGQVKMTPQVRYHIALCEEALGKLVAALGGYELALADAESVGDGVGFKQEVEASVNELRARIPKVVIERGPGAEAASIELDGVALGESSVGVEVPLDPGPHALVATAPGYKDYSETIEMVEEETRTVKINLESLASDDGPVAADAGTADEGVAAKSGKKYSFYPYVLMGVGAATMAASGVLYFGVRASDISELEDKCDKIDADHYTCENAPPEDKADLRKRKNRVDTLNYLSPALLGAGVLLAGAGATLFYLDLKNAKQSAASHGQAGMVLAGSAPGADLGGVSLVGTF